MKKVIKLVVVLILIAGLSYTGNIGYKGYQLYEETMENVDIEDTFQIYQSVENYVTIDILPSTFIDAIIAVEDHRFLEHKGFDLISFSRAFFRNVVENEFAAGGSTITQQLAKNLFFSFDKTMERKVAELIVAKKIEKDYEKDEILEMYVNIIYFGNGYVGIYNAAIGYFGKHPSQLTDAEAILLAGLPQAPSAYALHEHFEVAVERSKNVVDAMIEYGYIKDTEGYALKQAIETIKIQVN